MRRIRQINACVVAAAAVAIFAAAPAAAQVQFITESFEAPAGWTWGIPTEVVESGGDPGAYLQTAGILDSALPKLRTGSGVSSPFVGNLRAAGVRGVGVDLRIEAVNTPEGRNLSLELTNDGGTPSDVEDDCTAYFVGQKNIPLPGAGWESYVFRIPSAETTLPEGWKLLSFVGARCEGLTDDEAWNLVITDVSRLGFSYGDPSLFYIFQQWEGLGLDDPTIGAGR